MGWENQVFWTFKFEMFLLGILRIFIVSILQIKKYVSWKENSSAQRHIDREWESWDLDSGQFPGLFNLPRYFEVEVKGKEFYRNTILTP